MNLKPFDEPIYVTRPLLPDIDLMSGKLREIWDSKWLANNGRQHQTLEAQLAQFLKAPQLSLFNNGTIALIVACKSLRLTGEVITTPFTFPATPHVLMWNNIKPIFCDIDHATMNMDAARIESLITPQTTAILPVHIFGTPCDVSAIQDIANRYGLKVIYDAAHAFGVEADGEGIGNFGDISMFSFHATKLFHTAEGGALAFKDPDLKPRIDFLKNFGIKNEEEVVMPGINGKMNEIQAALGLLVLDCVNEEANRRKDISSIYLNCLKDVAGVSFLPEIENVKRNYQYFILRIDAAEAGISRNALHDKLKDFNIITRKYFHPLCSDFSCYKFLPSSAPASLPSAHKVSQEILCLPLYGALASEDAERICDIIKSLL